MIGKIIIVSRPCVTMAKKVVLKADYFWTLIHVENADFVFYQRKSAFTPALAGGARAGVGVPN